MVALRIVARFDFFLFSVSCTGIPGALIRSLWEFVSWNLTCPRCDERCVCVLDFVCVMLQNGRKDGGGKHSKDDSSPMNGGGGRGRRDSDDRSPDGR